VRALGGVGNRSSLPYVKQAEQVDERFTQVEAKKALAALQ
jgi:hypothetical protein